MQQLICDVIEVGLLVYGMCVGLIFFVDMVLDGIEGQEFFGGMDIDVWCNVFGCQIELFEIEFSVLVFGQVLVCVIFICVLIVECVGVDVEVFVLFVDGMVVVVEQGSLFGMSFYLEVDGEMCFYE